MSISILFILQFLFFACLALYLRGLKKSIKKAQHKTILILQSQEKLLHALNLSVKKITSDNALPPLLTDVPFADKMGIVLSIKQIAIPNIRAPYNASIGFSKNGYVLFFRYDTPSEKQLTLFSHIGCIHLSSDFEPIQDSFIKIDTKSAHSEDARFFEHLGHPFLVFNDLAEI